jgi:hypothetical protein
LIADLLNLLLDDSPNLLFPCWRFMGGPDAAATVQQIPDRLNVDAAVLK